jgi:hypothetical protein
MRAVRSSLGTPGKNGGPSDLCVLAFASKQRVEAPVAAALRCHVKEEETEQNSGHPLVLNR